MSHHHVPLYNAVAIIILCESYGVFAAESTVEAYHNKNVEITTVSKMHHRAFKILKSLSIPNLTPLNILVFFHFPLLETAFNKQILIGFCSLFHIHNSTQLYSGEGGFYYWNVLDRL